MAGAVRIGASIVLDLYAGSSLWMHASLLGGPNNCEGRPMGPICAAGLNSRRDQPLPQTEASQALIHFAPDCSLYSSMNRSMSACSVTVVSVCVLMLYSESV